MIKNYGNCGNIAKLNRILKAWSIAKHNKCGIRIVFDELVYGKNSTIRITDDEIADFTLSGDSEYLYLCKDNIVVNRTMWWDVTVIQVLW